MSCNKTIKQELIKNLIIISLPVGLICYEFFLHLEIFLHNHFDLIYFMSGECHNYAHFPPFEGLVSQVKGELAKYEGEYCTRFHDFRIRVTRHLSEDDERFEKIIKEQNTIKTISKPQDIYSDILPFEAETEWGERIWVALSMERTLELFSGRQLIKTIANTPSISLISLFNQQSSWFSGGDLAWVHLYENEYDKCGYMTIINKGTGTVIINPGIVLAETVRADFHNPQESEHTLLSSHYPIIVLPNHIASPIKLGFSGSLIGRIDPDHMITDEMNKNNNNYESHAECVIVFIPKK